MVDRGAARALAAEAVVTTLRRLTGRGPEHAKAAFLGDRTITVEAAHVLTATDRTLAQAGDPAGVSAVWRKLVAAIGSELATEVGRALAVEATCVYWVMDANADRLLLVFRVTRR